MANDRNRACPVCGEALARVHPARCPHCKCILRFGPVVYGDEILVRLDAVVKKSKFPADAFEFMACALRAGFAKCRMRGERGMDAAAVCDVARQLAIVRHGTRSARQLQEWGITSSLEIGQMVLELSEAGFCQPEEGDSLEIYRDIYVVGDHTWNAVASLRGICGTCGYDLRGSPSYRCPECGTQNTRGRGEGDPTGFGAVRPAVDADSAEIAALTKAVFAELRAVYVPGATAGAVTAGGEWVRVVAIVDGGIVGTLQYQERDESVHVKAIAVRADWRRQGVARAMIGVVVDEARRRGLGRVTLYTVKQTGNVTVFERLGFGVVREEADATVELVGGGVAVDVLMERRLEGF